MTDSKTPWLARGGAIALMMAAGIALAACSGGGDGLNEDEEATLQERLVTAEAEAAAALVAQQAAEAEKAKAEVDKEAAERLLRQERQQRRDLEVDLDRAEQETEEARQQVTRGDARLVLAGLESGTALDSATVAVVPRYIASAEVTTTNPSVTFGNPTTGSLLGWFKTAFHKSERNNIDRLEVYSDVERATQIPFRDSDYNDGTSVGDGNTETTLVGPFEDGSATEVIDNEGMVVGWLDITPSNAEGSRNDAASGVFPSGSAPPTSYTLADRGRLTQEQYTALDPEAKAEPVNDFETVTIAIY